MDDLHLPEFLQNKSLESIHSTMLSELPENIDKSQGQHAYNLTRPTAIIAAELCQQTLPNILRLIFPMWAYGEWLDYHAEVRGISRRPATVAYGKLMLTLTPGTEISTGSEFSTASVDGEPAIIFRSVEGVHADGNTVEVPVMCTQSGMIGNVAAHTVVFKVSKISGIKAVDNPEVITGGTEEETDESLRERILELDRSRGVSFVGSVSDYKRWSREIAGVGEATVIPAQDDSGLVTVVITDSNGAPANENLCKAVYNHIMSPENPELRLTPPNARLEVVPPEIVPLNVSSVVRINSDSSIDAVKEDFLNMLKKYLATARADEEIRYTQIGKILAGTNGVYDYKHLTLNGGMENIPLTNTQLPHVDSESVCLEGEVLP